MGWDGIRRVGRGWFWGLGMGGGKSAEESSGGGECRCSVFWGRDRWLVLGFVACVLFAGVDGDGLSFVYLSSFAEGCKAELRRGNNVSEVPLEALTRSVGDGFLQSSIEHWGKKSIVQQCQTLTFPKDTPGRDRAFRSAALHPCSLGLASLANKPDGKCACMRR